MKPITESGIGKYLFVVFLKRKGLNKRNALTQSLWKIGLGYHVECTVYPGCLQINQLLV